MAIISGFRQENPASSIHTAELRPGVVNLFAAFSGRRGFAPFSKKNTAGTEVPYECDVEKAGNLLPDVANSVVNQRLFESVAVVFPVPFLPQFTIWRWNVG